MAKDRGGPPITFQLLFWPATDANFATESYQAFETGRFLPRAFMEFGWNMRGSRRAGEDVESRDGTGKFVTGDRTAPSAKRSFRPNIHRWPTAAVRDSKPPPHPRPV